MRLHEILTESQELQEGPILNKIGSAVGKGVGALAKGVGAVAGGVAGLGSAIKKGFQAGKSTVAGAGDDTGDAATTPGGEKGGTTPSGTTPTDNTAGGKTPAPVNKKAPVGGTTPTDDTAGGETPPKGGNKKAPVGGTTPTDDTAGGGGAGGAGGTAYAQAQQAIQALQPKDKQKILALLQKDPKVKAKLNPAPAPGGKPAAPAGAAPADAGAGAMGQMAGQLAKGGAAQPNTMANAPVSKTNTAKPGNPNAAPAAGTTQDGKPHWDPATGKGAKYDGVTGEMTPAWKAEQDKQAAAKQTKAAPAKSTTGQAATQAADAGGNPEQAALDAMKAKNPKLAGMMAQAGMDDQGNDVAPAKKPRSRKKAASPSQAEIDADREAKMGPTSDSVIRRGNLIAEGHLSIFRPR